MPQRPDRIFLALRVLGNGARAEASGAAGLEARGKLLDRGAFADVAANLTQQRSGLQEACQMTLLTLGGLEELMKRLDGDVADGLMGEIVGQLQASSLDGAAAGRLDREKFGFVHEVDLDAAAVEQTIAASAKRADPAGRGVAVNATTIALAGDGLTEADKAKALVYAINKYADAHRDFGIGELTEGYRQMAADTLARIRTFRQTISEGTVDVLFQPIVGIKDRKLHHYEALARLRSGGPEASPAKFIQFAEESGADRRVRPDDVPQDRREDDAGPGQPRPAPGCGQSLDPLAREPGAGRGADAAARSLRNAARRPDVRDHRDPGRSSTWKWPPMSSSASASAASRSASTISAPARRPSSICGR